MWSRGTPEERSSSQFDVGELPLSMYSIVPADSSTCFMPNPPQCGAGFAVAEWGRSACE